MNSHSSTPVSDASPKIHDQDDWETRPYALTRLNSLDCWDYTIELECLQGPQGKIFVECWLAHPQAPSKSNCSPSADGQIETFAENVARIFNDRVFCQLSAGWCCQVQKRLFFANDVFFIPE
jgi:hypothetical protein